MVDVHLINHTHWDREWFLTHEYTTAWIPALIDSLEALVEQNPDYTFLFDGQTLVIEDLLNTQPQYRERVKKLVTAGQLEMGPCYSQPDWRIASGELHIRNLVYGLSDARSLGGSPDVAWLVDTFGHISQAPQLLDQVGIRAAYVWRGVPAMVPLFRWTSPDGTELATVDLFGGYRNLYGITKTEEIAVDRLIAETEKLAPRYDGLPVPLFDGYDLDTEPEDPARWYADHDLPAGVALHASSPGAYVDALIDGLDQAAKIEGELLSGKFGSTFPGSLSARTYLKVLHHDCEHALHRRVEPLAVLARAAGKAVDTNQIEQAGRTLLQNGVHDCICGVSIDQVHERMERSYAEVLTWVNELQDDYAKTVLAGFAPNAYAVATASMPMAATIRCADAAVAFETNGIGVSTVTLNPVQRVDESIARFDWKNDHYEAAVDETGIRLVETGPLLRLIVRADDGDTYSSEPGAVLGELSSGLAPIKVDESDIDTTIRTQWSFEGDDIHVTATVDARFDASAVVDLTIELDSTGVGFRVDAEFETQLKTSTVHASMQFDVVERPHDETDLLEFDIDPGLAAVLMGQREVGHVTEFPFHDFVALSTSDRTAAVLAKGLRSYRSTPDGTIRVALRRSVEWLARTGLQLRSGDAGPAMYVPGARCERAVIHRLGFAVLPGNSIGSSLLAVNEAFQNPPLIAEVTGTQADAPSEWRLFTAALPSTSCTTADDAVAHVRLFNPTSASHVLEEAVDACNPLGESAGAISEVGPYRIATVAVPVPQMPAPDPAAEVTVLSPVVNRVGASRSKPEVTAIAGLETRIDELAKLLAENERELAETNGDQTRRLRLTHREYVLDRERLELTLSRELNRRRAATTDVVSIPDEPDPVIAQLGADLNDLRVKRRIYDYVVQALA